MKKMKRKNKKKSLLMAIKKPTEKEVILKKVKVNNFDSINEIVSKMTKCLDKKDDLSSIGVRYIFDKIAIIYNNDANIDNHINFIFDGDYLVFGTVAFVHYEVIYHEDIDDFDILYSDITHEDLDYLEKLWKDDQYDFEKKEN